MVEVNVTDEFASWYEDLGLEEQEAVGFRVGPLEYAGVTLGFPYSSDIKGCRYAIRERRTQHRGAAYRVLYAFDRKREAVLIIGGDKAGNDRFYEEMIPRAERIWEEYLRETEG